MVQSVLLHKPAQELQFGLAAGLRLVLGQGDEEHLPALGRHVEMLPSYKILVTCPAVWRVQGPVRVPLDDHAAQGVGKLQEVRAMDRGVQQDAQRPEGAAQRGEDEGELGHVEVVGRLQQCALGQRQQVHGLLRQGAEDLRPLMPQAQLHELQADEILRNTPSTCRARRPVVLTSCQQRGCTKHLARDRDAQVVQPHQPEAHGGGLDEVVLH
mmetsp:Transcript_42944/g.110962  ORF Transcript_42944/g.110962 Transcript_42944/m.110962 type:complete len:212 (-) Transcript_42944:570-1205(-)